MKNKGLWRKMLAGCLALTLSLSSSMAAFSTEEEPAAPEEAAVEEIPEAVEEEEPFTVEEDDISEEGPALEAEVASVAADVVPDGLVEDLDTLEAAGDEEYITITFYGGDGVHSRGMDENGNAVTNEYGDYVYDGGSTVEEEMYRYTYLSMDQYRTLFQKEGYRLRGWISDNGIYCDYDEGFGIWDYVPDDAQEWNLTADWEPTVTVTLNAGEGSSFNTKYIGYNDYRSNSGTSCKWDVNEDYQLYLDDDLFFKEGEVLAGWNGDDGEYYSVCDQYSFTEDITLTADWAEPIEVTLDLGDGVYNNSDDPVNDGKSVIVLNKAYGTVVDLYDYRQYSSLEGNKLTGWIVYDADGTEIDDCGPDDEYWVDGPVTLMADWKTAVTVTWHRNLYDGDTFSTENTYFDGEEIDLSDARDLWDDDPEIEDSGLLLAGVLNGSTSGTLLHFSDELSAEEGLHLYLKWTEPVILTLDPNGGFFGSEDETEPKEVPVVPGKDYYVDDLDYYPNFNGKVFTGWVYEDGTPAFPYDEENDEEYPEVFEEDTTLYAVWEEAYTVMLDPNGGYWYEDTDETAPRPFYLQKGYNLYWYEPNEPEHASKMLLGWADEQGKLVLPLYEYDRETGDDAYITPSGDMTLKAVWADPVTVTIVGGDGAKSKVWDDDGYSFDGPSTIQVKCAKGGNFTELDRDYFEKEGYIITGWKIGSTVYSDPWYSFKPAGNVTVTAVWAKEVIVSWNLMGGYVLGNGFYTIFKKRFAEGDRIEPFDEALKDGYALAGWNTTQEGAEAGNIVYPVEYDLTATDELDLFAVWKPAYTVTFDGNGGIRYDGFYDTWVETVDVPIIQGDELDTISWPNFEYEADGKAMALEYWSTTDPNVEDPVEADWSQTVEGDMRLYAVWAPGAVITFNLNGGYTWDHDGKTDKYQEVLTMEWGLFRHSYFWGTAPAGKTFVGWTTVKNDPSTLLPDYIPGTDPMPFFGTGDKELFALWSAAPGTKLTGSDGASYTVGKEGDVTYNAPKNKTKIKSATVPDKVTIGGSVYNVTSIAANAFSGAKKLKTVTIGSNIRTIGAKAFFKTPMLKKVTIKSAFITSIGSKAFQKAGSKSYKKLKITVPKANKAAYTAMLKKAKLNKKCKIK